MRRRALLSLSAAASAAACTPLGAFDTLVPRDGGARRVGRDLAYGEGPRRTLDVYAPWPTPAGAPVIVFFYGGGWDSGRKQDYGFVGAAFAARGFVTAIPNYRLVPEVRFPTFVEDCAAATAWVAANAGRFGGDGRRLVLVGHSAGAYNAAMLALDRSFLEAVGAPPIRGFAGLAGPYDFFPFDVEASQRAFGAYPDPAATQPVNFARADAPPTLLLTGDADETVRPRNSEALARALRAAGAPVEVRTYPGVDHVEIMLALSRPLRGRAPTLEDVTRFAREVTP